MGEPVNKRDTMTNQYRAAAYPIAPLSLQRWSPRAFEATAMPLADLYTILREIPSSRLPLETIAFVGRFAPKQTKDLLDSTEKAEEIVL